MRCSTLDLNARQRGLACCSTFLFALCLAPFGAARALDPQGPSANTASAGPVVSKDALPADGNVVEPEPEPASVPMGKGASPANGSVVEPEAASAPVQAQRAKPLVGTPLPPPPGSLPAAKIARGVWRGTVRLDAALSWSLPLPTSGTARASGDLYGFGAELGASVRFLSSFGLGVRWAMSPHQNLGPSADVRWLFDARSSNRLMITARGYWPSKQRLQPFVEVAGGYLYLNATASEPAARGGSWSASLGLDGLILPGWTIWGAARYRGMFVYERFGHRLEVALGASLHF